MAKNFSLPKIYQKIHKHLGVWSIPLVSTIIFLPLFLTYGLSSKSDSDRSGENAPVLSLEKTPPTTEINNKSNSSSSVVTEKPVTSPSATPQESKEEKLKEKNTPSSSPTSSARTASQKQSQKQQTQKPKTTAKTTQQPQKSLLPADPSYKPPQLEIKVALLKDAANAVIGTSTNASLQDRNGRVIKKVAANQGMTVYPKEAALSVGASELPYAVWVQPEANGFVYVGDRWYRGKLLLVSQGNSLLAINYVNLEDYLYSVVGSEMHANAPIEALKAQAIAARSYALVHMIRPASEWYNLGATQRWQAYKGVANEYNTTHRAVNETTGQILSHNGGIVESLYAATEEIVSRVHRGAGMSQTGAYDLALQGYDYQQILDRYYPGVSLARIAPQK
jgi:peptidoglycan hydrolase-like amidase